MSRSLLAFCLTLPALALSTGAIAQQQSRAPITVVADKYQRDWDKGNALELKGLAELEKAQRDVIKYTADVESAQNNRRGSSARSQAAEQDFRKLTLDMPDFRSGDEAEKWARDVKKTADDWAKYGGRTSDANDDFSGAVRKLEKAQEAVNKAERRVEEGRTMKASAEQKSRLTRAEPKR